MTILQVILNNITQQEPATFMNYMIVGITAISCKISEKNQKTKDFLAALVYWAKRYLSNALEKETSHISLPLDTDKLYYCEVDMGQRAMLDIQLGTSGNFLRPY